MARRIIAYVLFVLGFLTVTFFRKYSGQIIPYSEFFWLAGLAMFLFGWYLLRFSPTFKESKDMERLQKLIEDLKVNGEKIRVDFSQCEIKTNDYTEERPQYGGPNGLTLNIER